MLTLLACPQCKAADLISHGQDKVKCTSCETLFPLYKGTLALFSDEKLARAQWANKLAHFQQNIKAKIDEAGRTSRTQGISERTQKRAAAYAEALEQHQTEVEKILIGFDFNLQQNLPLAQLLGQRISSRQHILSYFQNIFRDWAWENSENQVALELVSGVLPPNNLSPLVVLGSGPGRLAFDLARHHKLPKVMLIDINPIQLSISRKMWANESLQLTEINEHPFSEKNLARRWDLRPPEKLKTNNVSHLWADAINLPLKKNSDILILTPWFIDIIPEDFASFARRVNTRLSAGSYWINFGPLGFGAPEKLKSYTQEEIQDLLQQSGFEIEVWVEHQIPYLHSPLSGQKRDETVILWRAKKISAAKEPADFQPYPSWMIDLDQPIPHLPEFRELAVKSQFEGQILSAIDGKLSLRTFADSIARQSGISPDDALNLLLIFFSHQNEK